MLEVDLVAVGHVAATKSAKISQNQPKSPKISQNHPKITPKNSRESKENALEPPVLGLFQAVKGHVAEERDGGQRSPVGVLGPVCVQRERGVDEGSARAARTDKITVARGAWAGLVGRWRTRAPRRTLEQPVLGTAV